MVKRMAAKGKVSCLRNKPSPSGIVKSDTYKVSVDGLGFAAIVTLFCKNPCPKTKMFT
jgi:hypothetical protein